MEDNELTTEEVSLIVMMRLYDVMLGIYNNLDNEKATRLIELHRQGKILGPLPAIDIDSDEQ